jgi:3'(2'), 5'-bisphosphate nucleotidase
MDDHQLAAWLAQRAGELLVTLRGGPLDGAALGASATRRPTLFDVEPEDAAARRSHPFGGKPRRSGAAHGRRVWILDPLDGTREYSGLRSDWAVHVALAVDGVPAAGAVAQPDLGRTFDTGSVPRSHAPGAAADHAGQPDPAARRRGRTGGRARGGNPADGIGRSQSSAVIAGEADLYFHSGGQHEWDNCAPVAVALPPG